MSSNTLLWVSVCVAPAPTATCANCCALGNVPSAGDETFGGGLFPHLYEEAGGWVLTSKQLPKEKRSWKNDLFAYRKQTIELLFQRIIQSAELKDCRVKGEGRNGAFVLANVWVYQVCFLTDFRAGKPIACIKDHLDCARWRIPSG